MCALSSSETRAPSILTSVIVLTGPVAAATIKAGIAIAPPSVNPHDLVFRPLLGIAKSVLRVKAKGAQIASTTAPEAETPPALRGAAVSVSSEGHSPWHPVLAILPAPQGALWAAHSALGVSEIGSLRARRILLRFRTWPRYARVEDTQLPATAPVSVRVADPAPRQVTRHLT